MPINPSPSYHGYNVTDYKKINPQVQCDLIVDHSLQIDAYGTKKAFDKKLKISIPNLQWIARNLSDCEGQHPKNGAILSLTASEILINERDRTIC